MSRGPYRPKAPDAAEQHREWLDLIEVSGPFLSLPVLKRTWPNGPDALETSVRQRLRREHATWQHDATAGRDDWVGFVLTELLGWGDALHRDGLDDLALEVAEHDATVQPSFALVEPGEDVKPDTVRMLGLVCEAGQQPTARIPGSTWAATPADRVAQLCRYHDVRLGLVTDGRWWTLVWAPRGGVTTTAVFDSVLWSESSERYVVRAFVSLLSRERFFGVPENERLPKLLKDSEGSQEEITEALGVQVREAVELLVAAFGRAGTEQRDRGESELDSVPPHEVYRGAVSVMMRVVFLLFAEERRLLPSDNELYASTYSAGRLCAELEQRSLEGSEEDLEYTYTGWHRLLALFEAVYRGVEHPRLTMHAHDGSLFDPDAFPWLPLNIDDRTVLHMLRAVQYVEVGTGRSKERRSLSFRSLDVEQIGYVYEGLLSFDGFRRVDDTTVGLVGKQGMESEVPLRRLERLAADSGDTATLAKKLAEEFKSAGIGSPKKLEKALAPLGGTEREEARKRLLAVTRGDYPLAERLLAFQGIIRTDLRGLPVVVLPGELFVTESELRKNTGTHYTPRYLAEEVVEHALEPLVYEPGPLTTADRQQWKLKSSDEILSLKVADIAMGSAAFLVAAARYLGAKLLEAWGIEGDERARPNQPTEHVGDSDEDPEVVEARRQVIEHCLYGADINPMAVEMAKLSLWLVSMDPKRPFTFLDDRLATGDSLLGITSMEQLENMHMDPRKGREIHEGDLIELTGNVRSLVSEVAEQRRELSEIDGTTLEGLNRKRALLAEADVKTGQAKLAADLTVGAALAHAGKGEKGLRDGSLAAADQARKLTSAEMEVREQARKWLDTDLPAGNFRRDTLHWPLVFPEVFEKGGFDAVIGNPPFLGGKKISGPLGSAYREYLVSALAGGVKGNADLIAYFSLRGHTVLNDSGQTGLIATNTLAQGDTREVGLDRIINAGVTIRRSVKSAPWPSKSAALEYCAVWTSRAVLGGSARRMADGAEVAGIRPSLDAETRVAGNPNRLKSNSSLASQGSIVLGMGFTMHPDQASFLIRNEPESSTVLFPYLNGEDVNSRPDCAASRWIVNFGDLEEDEARCWAEAWRWVEQYVKPKRMAKDAVKYPRMVNEWWKYWNTRSAMYRAIAGLERVVVLTRHTSTVMPVMVPTGQVYSDATVVFATEDTAMLALLSSAQHYWWAKTRSSSMKTDLRYAPSDVFETFPLPELTQELRDLGNELDTYRREVMLARDSGLTKSYNIVFDPECTDSDIQELRRIHREIDAATVRAYGWEDRIEAVGGLGHGFHKVGRETRYTIGPAAQREILDSLLELNHERYAEEADQGLHDKKKTTAKNSTAKKSKQDDEPGLFD